MKTAIQVKQIFITSIKSWLLLIKFGHELVLDLWTDARVLQLHGNGRWNGYGRRRLHRSLHQRDRCPCRHGTRRYHRYYQCLLMRISSMPLWRRRSWTSGNRIWNGWSGIRSDDDNHHDDYNSLRNMLTNALHVRRRFLRHRLQAIH